MHSTLLTPKEAAATLRVTRNTIYKLMEAGDLQSIKIGKSRRITRESIDAFIARKLDES